MWPLLCSNDDSHYSLSLSTICYLYLLSAICYLLYLAICYLHLPSAICYLLSGICHLLYHCFICYLYLYPLSALSAICYLLSVVLLQSCVRLPTSAIAAIAAICCLLIFGFVLHRNISWHHLAAAICRRFHIGNNYLGTIGYLTSWLSWLRLICFTSYLLTSA
jgi:putative flippase GtrA